MNNITITGFLKIELQISKIGPMDEKESEKIKNELFDFFKERELNLYGKIKHVRINSLEIEHNNVPMDTSSK